MRVDLEAAFLGDGPNQGLQSLAVIDIDLLVDLAHARVAADQ